MKQKKEKKMLIKTYLKWIFGCFIGIIIVDIVLALFGLVLIIGIIYGLIKNTLFLIFHPIRFFKEDRKPHKTTLKELIGFDWKDFVDMEKNKVQNNGKYSKGNVQIGNITIKGK